MTIHIASVITQDLFYKAYVLLNSIKCNKKPETSIEYYLFISDSGSFSAARYTEYFQALIDDHFQIHFEDVAPLHNRIHAPHTIVYYVRYLFPQLFPALDKIIHIDAGDAFVSLEKLVSKFLGKVFLAFIQLLEHVRHCRNQSSRTVLDNVRQRIVRT